MIRDLWRMRALVVIGAATLSGCVAASTTIPTTPSQVAPTVRAVTETPTASGIAIPTAFITTSVFTPAHPTVVAGADVPAGKYLFLEYWDDTVRFLDYLDGAGGNYSCPITMIDFPNYSYESGILGGFGGGVGSVEIDENLPLLGFAGFGMTGTGGGAYSYLIAVQHVPFFQPSDLTLFEERPTTAEDRQMTLFTINREGSVIIEVSDAWIALAPDQEWTQVERYFLSPDCEVESTLTIHNYGFLDQTQLRLNFVPSD